ncbi:SusC/RagA family TonB-linked outer membrane protein [Tellurirhabdus rosea]|uniref:SusC/RagA family TonB-linked outer membrane protein n=1 Tax=Tellurirhabdus rosea TaxID=2674997 RepID=UPI002255F8DE|nr:SusC/RagA family TonB-linked outer membrane protein [Tellurirhabdus rosea]
MYRKLLMFLALCLTVTRLWAQERQVSGTVTDEAGQAMPGANVVVKGTTRGTNTDASGAFRIAVQPGAATLTISTVGYLSQEVAVGAGQSTVSVTLQPDTRTLQEVTITGALGIERQAKTLTYSAQRVEGRQLTEVRDANFVNTLSGKVAGLVVTQGAGGPGAAARVVLRGNRSIQGSNNALFVIDGMPIDNSLGGQVGNDFGGFNGSDGAANINPDDIESISVLKGAAAAALYGSRAANGVIMVSTKRGKVGRVQTSLNSGVAIESPTILPNLQNTYGQGNGGNAGDKASGSWGAPTTTYPDNVRDFFRNGVSTNNSIGVTGGTEKVQSYFSYTHNYNQGLIPNNDLTRHTLNLRVSNQISKRFSTDARITYVNQLIDNKIKVGEESGIVMNVYKIPRSVDLAKYEQFEDAQGNPTYWTTSSIYMNPYWTLNRTLNNELRNRISALAVARYELADWLTLQGRVSYDRYDDRSTFKYYDKTLLFAQAGGSYQVATSQNIERNMDLLLLGNKKFGDSFALNFTLGGSLNDRSYVYTATNANGLLVPNKFDLSFANNLSVGTELVQRQLQALLGTAQFSYKDWLILDLTARNDWSSTLPKPYSYFYPSVGATVILSEVTKLPSAISFAKLRGSITQVGNDAPPYLLQQTYSFGQGGTGGFISRDDLKAIENLKPELTTAREFGADVRFLNNRLGLDFTWYRTNSKNQLLRLGLAPASGFSQQFINAGNVQNSGIELTLTGKPLSDASRLGWDVSVNLAHNVSKIVELHPDIKRAFLGGGYGRTAGPVVEEGGRYGDLYAQTWKRDAQGRFVVDANGKPVATDQQKIGNFNPNLMLGFSNTFTLGGWSARVLFDGRFGGIMTSGTDANLAFDGNADYTTANRTGNWVLPAVTESGETNTKAINAETFWTTVSGGRYSWGEFFTYDATNVRLREMSIGYTLNLPKFFIRSAQLSLVGRNLFFLYRGNAILDIPGVGKRKMQFDPDVNLGAGNYQGVEYGNLPSSRSVGLNLKLSF